MKRPAAADASATAKQKIMRKPAAADATAPAVQKKPAASMSAIEAAVDPDARKALAPAEVEVVRGEALSICRRLESGELKVADLGNSPDTKSYDLLRNLAPKWLASENHQKVVQDLQECYPGDPAFSEFAGIVAYAIDGGPVSHRQIYKILFSDASDKRFFCVGVENGHMIGDAANQFREFLETKCRPEDLREAMASSPLKLLENMWVEFIDAEGGSHA
ncbi:unnamed protein product [Prorocentrum cordatum]|uniref:Uncharacterized protein n=1 Tax=Prorocentrum cordatum TaxID=2364126 RepID=A0ABN9TJX7_9DINO|nr:unnamed protein product [Polarella glacialis]